MQYKLPRRRLERRFNLQIQVFINCNEEDVARFFLVYFSKIFNMFLIKVQQS